MDPNEDPYKITTYADEELYTILGFIEETPPLHEDLENKIIQELKNYQNDRTTSGRKMFQFLKDIYEHFFLTNSSGSTVNNNDNNEIEKKKAQMIDLEENDFEKEIDTYDVNQYINVNAKGHITTTNNFEKLGLDNLSQNELEAKLIQEIQKYKSINTIRGRKMYRLYTEIYKRLFDTTSKTSRITDFLYGDRDSLLDTSNIKLEQEQDSTKINKNNIGKNTQLVSSINREDGNDRKIKYNNVGRRKK